MKILAICVGQPAPFAAKSGVTGYFKQPQDGPVAVTADGVAGDFIGDLDHHGGVDQAVYLFGENDRLWWQDKLARECPVGFFGENLLIDGLSSADLCIGDIIQVGQVMLQVTSPRIPCATYAAVIKDKSALKDFYAADRPGAYARVLQDGDITAGDTATLIPYQGERISIVENMAAYCTNFPDLSFFERALTVPAHFKLHIEAKARLGLGG